MTTIFSFFKRYRTFILLLTTLLLCVILRNAVGICVVLSLCIIALLALRWAERWQMNRRIKSLTRYLCTVQDRLSLPPMETDEDGEWGVLQSEIYKVVALLRQQYSEEKRQKQYLADMLSNLPPDQNAADCHQPDDGAAGAAFSDGRTAAGLCRENRYAGNAGHMADPSSADALPIGSGSCGDEA